jgi:hypothetical protein
VGKRERRYSVIDQHGGDGNASFDTRGTKNNKIPPFPMTMLDHPLAPKPSHPNCHLAIARAQPPPLLRDCISTDGAKKANQVGLAWH